jgi:hypothetical protein
LFKHAPMLKLYQRAFEEVPGSMRQHRPVPRNYGRN